MVPGGCLRTDNRIFDFFWFTFCPFLIFFCLNHQMIFIWQKSEVFSSWQNYAKGITSAGMAYEIISSVANLVVFCFEECWIDCCICYTTKLKHPIKRLLLLMNQWFISIWLVSNFLFILSLLAKHLSKYYLKNENGESFVGRFEDIDFSCVLLPHIKFLLSKRKHWKLIQKCWSRNFCHCVKAASVLFLVMPWHGS